MGGGNHSFGALLMLRSEASQPSETQSEKVTEPHGRAALMDPDLAAEVRLRCGALQ